MNNLFGFDHKEKFDVEYYVHKSSSFLAFTFSITKTTIISNSLEEELSDNALKVILLHEKYHQMANLYIINKNKEELNAHQYSVEKLGKDKVLEARKEIFDKFIKTRRVSFMNKWLGTSNIDNWNKRDEFIKGL